MERYRRHLFACDLTYCGPWSESMRVSCLHMPSATKAEATAFIPHFMMRPSASPVQIMCVCIALDRCGSNPFPVRRVDPSSSTPVATMRMFDWDHGAPMQAIGRQFLCRRRRHDAAVDDPCRWSNTDRWHPLLPARSGLRPFAFTSPGPCASGWRMCCGQIEALPN
jgi:hypothetical protein